MEKTRIGIIGAGSISRRHLNKLLGFDDVSVVAVADPLIERAREMAASCGAVAYDGHERMLDAGGLDALYVCVPPFAHGAPEKAAIERGIPFFVEKPLALDLETAEEIARGVREKGLTTAVGYHWRYYDVSDKTRELLAEHPARLALGYWLDATPSVEWWVMEERSGGQIVEQTTHVFDLARYLMGEVNKVYATGATTERAAFPHADVNDISVATLHFDSGALATISSTCLLRGPHRVGLHLFCEGMALELSREDLVVDDGRQSIVHERRNDALECEDRDFVDAVRGEENRIRVPYAEALQTHRLTLAAARSAREGRELDLKSRAADPAIGRYVPSQSPAG
jgi:predicted dehydrogenase